MTSSTDPMILSTTVTADWAGTQLIEDLRERAAWVAIAESCTGGLLSSLITDVPGASDVYWGGFATYHDSAKSRLGVPAELIRKHGAVSEPVARALAIGALEAMREGLARPTEEDSGDLSAGRPLYALSTTGIAGPTGGTDGKPTGLCWIALAARGAETRTMRVEITGCDRVGNKAAFSRAALKLLAETLRPTKK